MKTERRKLGKKQRPRQQQSKQSNGVGSQIIGKKVSSGNKSNGHTQIRPDASLNTLFNDYPHLCCQIFFNPYFCSNQFKEKQFLWQR
jgi:hypothetical protein